MVETLNIGPYSIRLLPLYDGPLPKADAGSESEALALLLNDAVVNPGAEALAEAIEQSREGGDEIVSVTPDSDDPALARIGMMGRRDTLTVTWDALRKGLAELRSIRAAWRPEPGPWLFLRQGRSPFVTPQDHERIKKLEEEAAAIDALDTEAEVGDEPQELIGRRRRFLLDCEDAGLFATDYSDEREKWLDYWFASRLLALRRAALKLRLWGLLGASEDPSRGRVCLDYTRLELWPPGENGQKWGESALKLMKAPTAGLQGAIIERVGGKTTIRVWWRRDGYNPMLLAVAK